jgi:hypothetical protein
VLGAKFESPLYAAVIACVPTVSVLVESVATPLLLRVEVPRLVEPSRKLTVPVGTPLSNPGCGVTVAVKVTDCPKPDGLRDDASAAIVAVRLVLRSTDTAPPPGFVAIRMSGLLSPFVSAVETDVLKALPEL